MRPARVLGLLALVILWFHLGGCNMEVAQPSFQGYYLDKAKLTLDPDPQARRPSSLESGDHWMVWLSSFQKGGRLMSGRGRQTTIFIEFAMPPELDKPIDLAVEPLQVSYEYGGEAMLYISRQATGTMVLHAASDNEFLAELDISFTDPILGSDSQHFKDKILLHKHPHPDFTTPGR
jgi:hypothetical protein